MKALSDKDIANALDAMRPETPDPAFAQRVLSAAAVIRQEPSLELRALPRAPQFLWAFAGLGAGVVAALLILMALGNFQDGGLSWPAGMGYSYIPIEDVLRPLLTRIGGLPA